MNLLESVLSSIVLSISTNLDNLAVGMSYGLRNWIVPTSANITIAILSGVSTLVSINLGDRIRQYLPNSLAGYLGSIILIIIGISSIGQTLSSDSSEPEEFISHHAVNRLNLRDAVLLGLALTLTNLGTGIGAGIAQFDGILTSIFSFGSSLLTIGGGYWMGKQFSQKSLGIELGLIAGVLLIILGGLNLYGEL
ncbi:MAG: manganese efflux pump [Cyanobacteriota bacterium]|nr:manganese efflux pump [Cyanobacteriota bacterium]